MTALGGGHIALILSAGVGAGLINTVVGFGTLITFPALLAVGLAPVTANVANTVGLFPGSFAGAYGYRRELNAQRHRLSPLAVAAGIGGALGAVLLLVLPGSAFEAVVPALIALAVMLVIAGPWLVRLTRRARDRASAGSGRALWWVTAATGVYGGYFGAAQGVLLMAGFGLLLDEAVHRQNGLKNLLVGVVNFVAAATFAVTTHVDWAVAACVAAGSALGGVIGARIGRRLPPVALRVVIVVLGAVAIGKLLL
jgi:hypothetical protein